MTDKGSFTMWKAALTTWTWYILKEIKGNQGNIVNLI